ncbi:MULTISPECIES: helix-turn-helix transcriptional regulator [Winslowiella]|uniref:helix-turn-helix transcriptional regulator n=1 Tax=Winslowiella TaxID=2997349 RepID=UPI0028BE3C56|nr:helix-turn-helix transcriptional regulator [Winslowiella toletana]WNN45961.1 helix-turn-helix transcriptional regulator [Winslowiella toletana]
MNISINTKNNFYANALLELIKDVYHDTVCESPLIIFGEQGRFESDIVLSESEQSLNFPGIRICEVKTQVFVLLAKESDRDYCADTCNHACNLIIWRDDDLARARAKISRAISLFHEVSAAEFCIPDKGIIADYSALNQREISVIKYFGQGLNTNSIAKKLYLNFKTVSHYKRSAMRKLGVSDEAGFYFHALKIVGRYTL